jgi:hypothetical protein
LRQTLRAEIRRCLSLSAGSGLAALLLLLSPAALADDVMTPAGLPPVEIGMTLAQVEQALGKKLHFDRKDPAAANCFQATRPRDDKTLYMLERHRVTRIDTRNSSIAGPEGARVGDSEAGLKKRFGTRAVFAPHRYVPDGHYVTVDYPQRKLVFETENGRVTSWRIGLPDSASYVEGCS